MTALLVGGADVKSGCSTSATALHYAAIGGHVKIVWMLLDDGANVSSVDINGMTPLGYATKCGHEEIAALLQYRTSMLK